MFRTVVNSDTIASIGYDRERRLLHIEFRRTMEIFEYADVPINQYKALMAASSKGKYFNARIRDAGYVCRKLGS